MTMSAQGRVLADSAPLELSIVLNARWRRHQRLALATD
jgi:hypothetical protein